MSKDMASFRTCCGNRLLRGMWFLSACIALTGVVSAQTQSSDLAKTLGITFVPDSSSTVILERDGKRYAIDVQAKAVHELVGGSASGNAANPGTASAAAAIFAQKCAVCHGRDAKGIKAIGTPNFLDSAFQQHESDADFSNAIHNGKGGIMPAWSGKLSESEISSLVSYLRSFSPQTTPQSGTSGSYNAAPVAPTTNSSTYEPGDDVLMSLPTGRKIERHSVDVNFAHRFAYDPAFVGTGRGEILFGLDGFAIPSFGFTFGITDRLSASIYRSPSIVGRPIQIMTGYRILDEHEGAPFNLTVRASIEGQNNFRKNYTENIEGIFSRSLTHRAQIYAVPTMSFNNRPLVQGGFRSRDIPNFPGVNTFYVGVGLAVDIRPTVALLAEVIPTLVNGRELGIHRPAYSFGIQKKLYRHAFTFGFSTGPGTTVSQRAGTRATFLDDPSADKPSGLFIGFNLMRQIH
jgi:mono/diheme cytochrome c family protein